MITAFRAEIARLVRRRVLVGTGLVLLVVGFGGPLIVLSSAKPERELSPGSRTPSIESLSGSGGGTEVFRYVAAFAGTLVFVVFVGIFALEFARGTYRTMLLRQSRRIPLLAGKLLALIGFAAAALATAEIITWLAALVEAPTSDVDTSAWLSFDAIGSAFSDLAMVMVWVIGYAVLGMMVAILVRSVPIALAVGIAWAGPFEHLLQDAWNPAQRYFPGLLLEIVGEGGVAGVSATRAVLTASAYALLAATVAGVVFARRDVTA